MDFNFVWIDGENIFEIPISQDVQVIGRGAIPHCVDKRISRNHVEITKAADSVTIKTLHTNPCFYKKNDTDDVKILHQNAELTMITGDKMGFLFDKYWFELRSKDFHSDGKPPDPTTVEKLDRLEPKSCPPICEDLNESRHVEEALRRQHSDNEATQSYVNKNLEGPSSPTILDVQKEKESIEIKQKIVENIQKSSEQSQELMEPTHRSTEPDEESTEHMQELAESTQESSEHMQELVEPTESTQESSEENQESHMTPVKRTIQSDASAKIDVKKIKKEKDVEIKREANLDEPGSSGVIAVQNKPPSPQNKTKPPRREKCMYGASCYRKNAQHKSQYSHPSDADWTDEQAPCPYGYACIRRNAAHWRTHTHPYGMQPPPPTGINNNARKSYILQRYGKVFYINAHAVNFFDDHFETEDSEGESVDHDYEF